MNKTMLKEVKGYTPLIDYITKNHGMVTSAIFGRMWRYCQGKDGVCYASTDTIAKEIGLSRRTTIRHIQILVEEGFLKDLTPELKHKPHTYADTGKAMIQEISEAVVDEGGVTESHTRSDRESHLVTPRGVTESHTKRVVKKESKKEETDKPLKDEAYLENVAEILGGKRDEKVDKRKEEGLQRIAKATIKGSVRDIDNKAVIAHDLGITPNWDTKTNQKFLHWLTERPAKQSIKRFAEWWYENDWRGKSGQPPSIPQIRELWPQAFLEERVSAHNLPTETWK